MCWVRTDWEKNKPFISTLVKDGSYSVQMDGILVNMRDLGFEYLHLDLFLCYLMGFFFGYFSSTSDLDPWLDFLELNQGSGATGISLDILQKKFGYHWILEGFARVQKNSGSSEIGLLQDNFNAEPRVPSSKQNEARGLPNWAHLFSAHQWKFFKDVLEHIIPFAQTVCEFMISCKKNYNC